jgi:myo-inositol-hexaphosphate 3-phosphohydrolase
VQAKTPPTPVVQRVSGLRPDPVVASLCILALLAACSGLTARSGSPYPLVENTGFPGSGDISDDSAIWVDKTDPGASVVIADSKADAGGGIGVFDMHGTRIQFRADGKIGNVDLREGFPLRGRDTVIVAANNRSNNTMSLWTLDPTTRTLTPVNARSIATSTGSGNYGLCLYHSKRSGKLYAFVTPNGGGSMQQLELFDDGTGRVDARAVRALPISSITESCVADDDLGHLYVGQEDVAIWKYGAEPDAGAARTSVDAVGAGHLVADIEGMAIAYGARGSGYLFVSSQGSSTFAVYARGGANRFVRSFKVVANGTIDAVSGTDGLDVTSHSVGPGFEKGLLVVHDESNSGGTTSNLKYVPLGQLVALSPPAP